MRAGLVEIHEAPHEHRFVHALVLGPTDHDVRFTFRSALTMNVAHHAGDDAIASFDDASAPEGHGDTLGFIGQIALARALVSLDYPSCRTRPGRAIVMCAISRSLRSGDKNPVAAVR